MGMFRKGLINFLLIISAVTIFGVVGMGSTGVAEEVNALVEYTDEDFRFLDIQGEYEEGVVLVKFKEEKQTTLSALRGLFIQKDIFEGISISSYEEIRKTVIPETFMELSGVIDQGTWYIAEIDTSSSVESVLVELARLEGVLYAEPNYLYELSPMGDYVVLTEDELDGDPSLSEQYYLDEINITDARAHLISLGINPGGSREVVVAVIDSGVDYTHPDLAANMWVNSGEIPNNGIDDDFNGYIDDVHGIDATNDSASAQGNPMDDNGHGTHVAGIIAADGDNNIGIRGVADNVRIMALKAGQASGVLTSSDIAEAIDYAVAKGADVINMSFGSYSKSLIVEDSLSVAFSQAVLVAAAGNDGYINKPHAFGKDMYPAAFSWVIGVMASDGDSLALFSNYDFIPEDSHEYNIVAPGIDILSTLPGGKYAKWDGTSMSAPIVAGIAALLKSKYIDNESYSSRFIMGQIVGTAVEPIAPPPGTLWESYFQVDANLALTVVPEPNLTFFEYYILDTPSLSEVNDGDGVAEAGETLEIALIIRNQWGQASDTIVTLDATSVGGVADPFVTFLTDTVDYGTVASFSSDDNGITFNEEQKATGIDNPFIIYIDPDTPNDHLVRINVTITASNGLDENDTTEYVFDEQHFVFLTRTGSEVPTIISEDMTLTNDKYWIIENTTLVEEGATLTIEAGTKVQFYSSEDLDFYAAAKIAQLEIRGRLVIQGTEMNPVELFPSEFYSSFEVKIDKSGNGIVDIQYARITNPRITANVIDHSYFYTNHEYMQRYYYSSGEIYVSGSNPRIDAEIITNSIFSRMYNLEVYGKAYGNLFDSNQLYFRFDYAENNVFLNNFAYQETQWGDISNINRSNADLYGNDNDIYINTNKIFRNEENGKTYIVVNSNATKTAIQRYAEFLGGSLAVLETDEEFEYVNINTEGYPVTVGLKYDYFSKDYTWIDGTSAEDIEVSQQNYDGYMYYSEYAMLSYGSYYSQNSSYYLFEISGEIYVNDILFDNENVIIGDQTVDYQIQYSLVPFTSAREDLVWTSNDLGVVTVDQNGVVNPVGIGETTITVETNDGVVSKTIVIKVIETIPLEGMAVSPSDKQININTSYRLLIDFLPYNTTERGVVWTSSDEVVASVDSFGVVTGLSPGVVTITATSADGTFSSSSEITIVIPVKEIYLDEDFLTFSLNDSDVELGASVFPFDATNQNLVWSSSNERVAYVDEFGKLQPVSVGNVVIRVYAENTNIYDDIIINITEEELAEISVLDATFGGDYISNIYVYTLMSDGTVWYFGNSNTIVPKKVNNLEGVVQIDSKNYSSYALKDDGTVWYLNGTSTSKVSGLTNITKISVQSNYLIALKDDGTAWGIGANWEGVIGSLENDYFDRAVQIDGVTGVVDIVATRHASVYILEDGTVVYMSQGSLEIFSEVLDVLAVDHFDSRYNAYDDIVFYVDSGFKVFRFYQTSYTERTDYYTGITGETIVEIGSNSEYERFQVALTESGNVYTRWSNTYGQLGIDNDGIEHIENYVKLDLENIVNIEVGINNVIAIDAQGDMYIWGNNSSNQITDFSGEHQYKPFKVSFGLVYEAELPYVESSVPLNYEIEFDVDGNIIVDFSEAIYESYNFNYISLVDSSNNTISISKSIGLDKIIIDPVNDLRFGETYTLVIDNQSVRDIFNNYNNQISIRFTTEEVIYLNRINITVDVNSISESIIFDVNDKYNGELVWISLDETIVTVENGVLTPVSEGATTVLVSTADGQYVKTINVDVKNIVPITSIDITEETMIVNSNQQVKIERIINPTDYNEDIIWTSSDTNIAQINEFGFVYGFENGEVTITASNKAGDIFDTIVITVIEPVSRVVIDEEYKVVNTGDIGVVIEATAYPETATNKNLIWQSSDETVATVDQNGAITIVGPGNVVIRAQAENSSIYDQIVLFVSDEVASTTKVIDVAIYGWYSDNLVFILLDDGSVWYFGYNNYEMPQRLGLENVVALGGSRYQVYGVDSSGNLWNLYNGGYYQQTGLPENNPVIDVAGNGDYTVVALEDGSVYGWGNNDYGQIANSSIAYVSEPSVILGLSNIVDVEVANYAAFFLDSSGDVYYRGGALSVEENTQILEVSNIVSFTQNQNYEPSYDDSITFYDTDNNIIPVYFDSEGIVVDSPYTNALVDGVIAQMATTSINKSNKHTLVLTTEGYVYAYGENYHGQLGIGDIADSSEDPILLDLENIVKVFTIKLNSFAIDANGVLYVWGSDNHKQVPDLETGDRYTPYRVYFGMQRDTTNPVVESITPDLSEYLFVDSTFTLRFNEYIEQSYSTSLKYISIFDSNGIEIPSLKEISINEIQITLLEDLKYGETYRLVINESVIRDAFNNYNIYAEYTFTTESFVNVLQSSYKLDTNEGTRQILFEENSDFEQGINFASQNEDIVTVDENGLMTPVAIGTAEIYITSDDGLYTRIITVEVLTIIPVQSITFDDASLDVDVNTTRQLVTNLMPLNTNEDLYWTSSDEVIATVNEFGQVTGHQNGQVIITVSNMEGTVQGSIIVDVVTAVEEVSFSEDFMPVVLDETLDLMEYQLLPVTATNQNVVWQSSNESVAYVDADGYLHKVSEGTAVIRVSAEGRAIYDDVIITITLDDSLSTNVVDLTAETWWDSHTKIYALMDDGTVWFFGGGSTLLPKQVNITDVIQVESSGSSTYALKSDGTVYQLNSASAYKVSGLTDVIEIAIAADHRIALKDDGTVWGWGYNGYGQIADMSTNQIYSPIQMDGVLNVVEIEAAYYVSIFRYEDGTIKYFNQGSLKDLEDVVGVTSISRTYSEYSFYDYIIFHYEGLDHDAYKFESNDYNIRTDFSTSYGDETIVGFGGTRDSQNDFLITDTGDFYIKGENGFGQLGNGTTDYSSTFQKVDIENVAQAFVFMCNTVVITTNGEIYIWGYNNSKQITDFTTENRLTPYRVYFGLESETEKPYIESTSPDYGDIEVDIDGNIIFDFNEAVYVSQQFAYIKVMDSSGSILSITKTPNLDKLVIDPLNNLKYGEIYTITIPSNSVKDIFNNYNEYIELRFTTEELVYTNRNNITLDYNAGPESIDYQVNDNYAGELIWTSSDETVVTVVDGVLTPVSIGNANVFITSGDGNYTKVLTIEVKNIIPITSIDLTYETMTVNAKEEIKIARTINPIDYNEDVIWESLDLSIAQVDEYGYIYGFIKGDVTITASNKAGDIIDSILVTVVEPVEEVVIEEEYKVVNTSVTTVLLEAFVYPQTATNKTLVWQSSDEAVATVDALGNVTIVGIGNVVIRAQAENSSKYDDIVLFISDEVLETTKAIDVAIYGGYSDNMTYVLLDDGSVWYFGWNNYEMPQKLNISNVVQLSGSSYRVYALDEDGKLWNIDPWNVSQVTGFPAGNTVVDVASDGQYALALLNDGSVYGWGDNGSGQIGDLSISYISNPTVIPGLSNIKDVETGSNISFFLRVDGDVYYRGSDFRIDTNTKVASVSNIDSLIQTHNYHPSYSKGVILRDINNNYIPVSMGAEDLIVGSAFDFTGIEGTIVDFATTSINDERHTLILNDLGEVYSTGYNGYGQLGIGTTESEEDVVYQVDLENIVRVFAMKYNSFAIDADGAFYVWGSDSHSQIPDLESGNQLTPYRVYFGMHRDMESPYVETVTPNFNQEVLVNAEIVLEFNEYIQEHGGSLAFIKITDSEGNVVPTLKELTLNTLIITPLENLKYGESYTLTVPSSSLKDRFNNYIQSYTETFRTEDFINLETTSYKVDINEASRQIIFTENPNYSQNVIWDTLDESILIVDQNGMMYPVSEGITFVTVTTADGVYTKIISVLVLEIIPITNIAFDDEFINVDVNTQKVLVPNITPVNYNEDLRYSSDNDLIATVNEFGVVTGLDNGSVTITVTNPDETVVGTITINVIVPVEGFLFNDDFMPVQLNETLEVMSYVVTPENATNKDIYWQSSDESIAYVDVDGFLHKIASGTVVIRGTVVGTDLFDEIVVTVSENAAIVSDVIDVVVTRNYVYALMDDGSLWYWGQSVLLPKKINTENIISISGEGYSLYAVNATGLVFRVDGESMSQQTGLSDIVEVSSAHYYSIALKADGTVWAWGNNNKNVYSDTFEGSTSTPIQIQGLTDIIGIAATYNNAVFLKSDGTIIYRGNYMSGFRTLEGVFGVAEIEADINTDYHYASIVSYRLTDGGFRGLNCDNDCTTFGIDEISPHATYTENYSYHRNTRILLTADGLVYTYGYNAHGELGNDTFDEDYSFNIVDLPIVVDVKIDRDTSIAITADGDLYMWGKNDQRQIPNLMTENVTTPFKVIFGIEFDTETPYIETTNLSVLKQNEPIELEIELDFSKALNEANNYIFINLIDSQGGFVSAEMELVLDKLFIRPIGDLKFGETYTIHIPDNALVDVFNNYLPGEDIVFTTEDFIDVTKTSYRVDINETNREIAYTVNPKFTEDLIFTSLDETIVTVDSNGVMTPTGVLGTTSIIISNPDGSYTKVIEVEIIERIAVTAINITEEAIVLGKNEIQELEYTVNPVDANEDLFWTSSNENVVVVDENGNVTGVTDGTAVVYLKNSDGTVQDFVTITVVVAVTEVVIDEEFLLFSLDTAYDNIIASILPLDASIQDIVWISANSDIAYVDEFGDLHLVSAGTVILRAVSTSAGVYDEVILSISDTALEDKIIIDTVVSNWGGNSIYALMDDGTLWNFGHGYSGNSSNIETRFVPIQVNITDVKAIYSGQSTVGVIKNDGTVWMIGQSYPTGDNYWVYTFTQVPDLTNVVSLAVNDGGNIAIKEDGTVWAWGTDSNTPVFQINGLSDIIDVAGYGQTATFLDSNGDVFKIESFSSTPVQLEEFENIKLLSNNHGSYTLYLVTTSNEVYKIYMYNDSIFTIPMNFDNTLNIVSISNYYEDNAVVIYDDGSNDVFGHTDRYLGDGVDYTNDQWLYSTNPSTVLVDNIKNVSMNYNNGAAVTTDGDLYVWGYNEQNQLVDFTFQASNTPNQIFFGIQADDVIPVIEFPTTENNPLIAVGANIIIDFDEAIFGNVDYKYIRLRDPNGNLLSMEKIIELDKLIIDPSVDLEYDTVYTVEIPVNAIGDMFQNMVGEVNITITTEAASAPQSEPADDNVRDIWTSARLNDKFDEFIENGLHSGVTNNAILNNLYDLTTDTWLKFNAYECDDCVINFANNYWGTTDRELVEAHVFDFDDLSTLTDIVTTPYLLESNEAMYPHVVDVIVSTASDYDVSEVGVEEVTFTVLFNRDMDVSVDLGLFFGPDYPYTDFKVAGDWVDARTWVGTANITPITGDGRQFFRIRDAVAASDGWLNIGDDNGRFMFEIITAGTESMTLQVNGSEGRIELTWVQNDFELLAGYNIYRSTEIDGTYEKINTVLIPGDELTFKDFNVEPAEVYFYRFTVMRTDLTESDFSNVAYGAAYDTVPPVMVHTPITVGSVDQEIFVNVSAQDNNEIESVILYYRLIGDAVYKTIDMLSIGDTQFTAKISGSFVTIPGIEYYIEVSDGLSTVRRGTATLPFTITVEDRPTIETMYPTVGNYVGGTVVTLNGTNFQVGAKVYFSNTEVTSIEYIDEHTIKVTVPEHFPSMVDVRIVNPSGEAHTLYNSFEYFSDDTTVSVGNIKAGKGQEVFVPVTVDNLNGLIAGDMRFSYDDSKLEFIDVLNSALTNRFSIVVNNTTLGQIVLSMANSSNISGSGDLFYLKFLVKDVSSVESGSILDIAIEEVSFNSESISIITNNGSIEIANVYVIGGSVTYYSNSSLIDNVQLMLDGGDNYLGETNEFGEFIIQEVMNDNYVLTATKDDAWEVNGISAYDATLVLRVSAGIEGISEYQRIAADVNSDGVVNSMDASQILQFVAGLRSLPFEGTPNVWKFTPDSMTYDDLSANHYDQDIVGILVGDVTGNYDSGSSLTTVENNGVISVGEFAEYTNTLVVPIEIDYIDYELYSFETTIIYDEALTLNQVVFDASLSQCFVVVNDTVPGSIRIAVACANEINLSANVFNIYFDINTELPEQFYVSIINTGLNEEENIVELMNVYNSTINKDVNNDGVVNDEDMAIIISQYNTTYRTTDISIYDFNSDGVIDIFDILTNQDEE